MATTMMKATALWLPVLVLSVAVGSDVTVLDDDHAARVDRQEQRLQSIPAGNLRGLHLHLAAVLGHVETIKMMIGNGANINDRDSDDLTPLHFAAVNGHVDACAVLINNSAALDAKDRHGYTALHYAAAGGHADIVALLVDARASIDLVSVYENTAAHLAVWRGHADVVGILLDAGAGDLDTLLLLAVWNRQSPDLLRLILRKRSPTTEWPVGFTTLTVTDLDGDTATTYVRGFAASPLHLSAIMRHDEAAAVFLDAIPAGAIDGADPDGYTALHESARVNCVAVVRRLLAAGAQVDAINERGQTPLHLAAGHGHVDVLVALLDSGASIELGDHTGWTALHYAANKGRGVVVERLLALEADVDVEDRQGRTAADVASDGDLASTISRSSKKLDADREPRKRAATAAVAEEATSPAAGEQQTSPAAGEQQTSHALPSRGPQSIWVPMVVIAVTLHLLA